MSIIKERARSIVHHVLGGSPSGVNVVGKKLEKISKYLSFEARTLRTEAFHRIAHEPAGTAWLEHRKSDLVYDFGANRGLNFEYYFDRGFNVIAIEANPAICRYLEETFSDAVASGQLTVLNYCLWDEPNVGDIEFYVSRTSDVLSTSVTSGMVGGEAGYRAIRVAARRPSDLFRQYGHPFYVKIDVEGLDARLLGEIFRNYAMPIRYISAESHEIAIFAHLIAAGYKKLKIIEGQFVTSPRYRLKLKTGEDYIFPKDAAGPFGEDAPGPWWSPDEAFEYLREHGAGWKDIHAFMDV